MKPFDGWAEIRSWLESMGASPVGRQFDRVWFGVVVSSISPGPMDISWYGGDQYAGDTAKHYWETQRRKAAA